MKKTLIIIPTYNEIENIALIIDAVFQVGLDLDVLVVDDNSPDGTGNVVKTLMKSHPQSLFLESREKKEGLGAAYIHGFFWALKHPYDYIFEMDADFSHNPMEIKFMLNLLEKETDVIIGSRYIKGVNVVNWPLSRILLSYFASIYVRFFTGMPVRDPTAGFVGYKRSVIEAIQLKKIKFGGYAFQIEMKYKAWIRGFKLVEHPIIFLNRSLGNSKMNGSIIWEALFGVLFLRINKKNFF